MAEKKRNAKILKIVLIAFLSLLVVLVIAVIVFWFLVGRPSLRSVDASLMRTRDFAVEELSQVGFAGDAVHMVRTIEQTHPIFLPIDQMYGLLPDDYEEIREWFLSYAQNPDITVTDFIFAAMRYITTLHDGHMSGSVVVRGESGQYTWAVEAVGNVLYAMWDARDGGLFFEDGSQVLEIGGVSVAEIMDVIDRYFFHENEFYRDFTHTRIFRRTSIIERAGGEVFENGAYIILYYDGNLSTKFIEFWLPTAVDDGMGFIIRHEMIDDIFFIDFRSFIRGTHINETAAAISRAVAEGTRNFIIDLRGNGGGDSRAGESLLQAMGITVPRGSFIHRVNRLAANSLADGGHGLIYFPLLGLFGIDYLYWESNTPENNNPNDVFVSVLTDVLTYSSATMFAYWVQDGGFGNIIGSPSRNSPNAFGNMVWLTLPYSELMIRVSYSHFMRPDASADPNVLWPDIIVDPADALYVAIEYLRNR